MAVYVDDMLLRADVPNGARTVRGRWSHLMADTRAELDEMADRLGLRRSWIQHPGTWEEHYDVTMSKRTLALKLGAVSLPIRDPAWLAFIERKQDTDPARQKRVMGTPGLMRNSQHRLVNPGEP